jgi:lambda family phage portal protein
MAKRQAPKSVRRAPAQISASAVSVKSPSRAVSGTAFGSSRMLGVRASYEAAGTKKRGQEKFAHARGESLRYLIGKDQPTIIKRCRYEIRNNPIANAIVEFIVGTTVGTGLRPRIADPELLALWNDWIDECDADDMGDFYALQALAMREIVATGEVFVRLRPRRALDGLPVPLQVQLLPSEFVPLKDDANAGIVSGVKFRGPGQRSAYLFHETHPGDGSTGFATEPKEIPADRIAHVMQVREAGQVRGEPWLVRSIIRLHELDEYEDAELVKKNFSARITAFFKRKSQSDANAGLLIDPETEIDEAEEMEVIESANPGDAMVLPDDYDVEFAPTHQAGSEFSAFVRQILSEACVGLAPIDLIMDGDLPERSQQLTLAKYEILVEQRRKMLIHKFCRPVWRAFLEAAVASGAWKGDPASVYRVKWTGTPLPKIRRHQEAQADVTELRSGAMTFAELVERRGHDYADHIEQLAKEAADRDRLGLTLDGDPRRTAKSGAAQSEKTDSKEEPEDGDPQDTEQD